MAVADQIKERIIEGIDQLPSDKLGEVLDFVDFLVARQATGQVPDRTRENMTPVDDPLRQFIGGVEHGTLARNIDAELYGS